MLVDRLYDEKLKDEDPNWKTKWDNRLGAFLDLYDYLRYPNMIKPTDLPRVYDFPDLASKNNQYYNEGFICIEERNELTYMISAIRDFIQSKQVWDFIMNRILLIRHGKTDWNSVHRIQGRTDIELNQEGVLQAHELAKLINLDEIDICLCSPLKRTKQTADIIINNRMNIIYDDLLLERCFGDYEGTIYDEEILKTQWDYKLNDSSNGLESLQDCLKRGKEFLDKINSTYDNKTILIITHGCFIKSLYYNITGYDENTNFLSFNPKNAQVYEYHI